MCVCVCMYVVGLSEGPSGEFHDMLCHVSCCYHYYYY